MNVGNIEIKVVQGDIIRLKADALVNPANAGLKMEKGLAGFLKKEGGAAIEEEALSKAPLKPGQAVATGAGKLVARHIIHAAVADAVGLVKEEALRQATASALKLADSLKIRSLAIPAVGCGEGHFPPVGAAKIMTQEILKFSRKTDSLLREITFCLYDKETFETFNRTVIGYLRHLQEDLGRGPYVSVDIIIECRGGIILVERSNPPYGWALPGGFLDYGESLEQAAIREAKEETNLDLVNLRQFHTYSEPGRDPRFHTITTVFVAEGQGEPKAGDDARNLKIIRPEALTEINYAFDHQQILQEYLIEKEFGDDRF